LAILFDLQDLGKTALKGLPEPTHVSRVLRVSSISSRFEALHASRLSAFVGREHELEILQRALEKARNEFCVIDIASEPGIGKSRLAYEFRQSKRSLVANFRANNKY
jgi:hypothetical protein